MGGEKIAGGKLKEAGTTHWVAPNKDATNESSFAAIPGGWYSSGASGDLGESALFWSSTTDTIINLVALGYTPMTAQ